MTLNPLSTTTLNYALQHGATRLLSSSSRVESTSVVLAFGDDTLDLQCNSHVTPSQGFDRLAADFNHPLLLTILGGLGLAVLWLRSMHLKKELHSHWK